MASLCMTSSQSCCNADHLHSCCLQNFYILPAMLSFVTATACLLLPPYQTQQTQMVVQCPTVHLRINWQVDILYNLQQGDNVRLQQCSAQHTSATCCGSLRFNILTLKTMICQEPFQRPVDGSKDMIPSDIFPYFSNCSCSYINSSLPA